MSLSPTTHMHYGVHMNKYDFYDHEKAEQLRSEHCKKGTDLLKRFYNAKQNGNQKDIERARKALIKHRADGEQMKELTEEAGFYWY